MGRSVKDFLTKLVNYGEKTFEYKGEEVAFFQKVQIKDIDECCKSAVTEVYDFDKCKELFSKIHKLKSPKSCDALKITIDRGTIDFIEIKGLQEFISRQLEEGSEEEKKKKIENKMKKLRLPVKITDSIYVLYNIMNRGSFELTNDEQTCYLQDVKKNYILVVDFDINDPRQLIAASLGKAVEKSKVYEVSIMQVLKEKLDNIPIGSLSHPQKSLIKTCSTIDKFYKNAQLS